MNEETIYQENNGQPVGQAVEQPAPAPQPAQFPNPAPASVPQTPPIAPPPSAPPPPPPPVAQDYSEGPLAKFHLKAILIVLAIILLIVSALFIVSKVVHKSPEPASGKVVLNIWEVSDQDLINSQMVSGFEKENPNVSISLSKQDPSDYIEKLKARIPNGNGPDLFEIHNTWTGLLSSSLLPFPQDLISQNQFSDKYFPAADTDLVRGGAIYAIPLNLDTLSLFTNSSLLSASSSSVPKTWQDFIDTAGNLTTRDDQGKILTAGAGIGTYDNIAHASDILALLFAQNGVNNSNFTASQDKISQALTFYTDFVQVENNVWDELQENSLQAFEDGKLAMYFGYASDQTAIKNRSPQLQFEMNSVPQLTSDNPVNIASYFALGISAKTTHQKEAILFTKYIIAHSQSFDGTAKSAVSSPFAGNNGDDTLSKQLNDALSAAVASIPQQSADQAAADLITGYSKALSSVNNSTPQQ